MNVVDFLEARIPSHNYDALIRNLWHTRVSVSHLGLFSGAKILAFWWGDKILLPQSSCGCARWLFCAALHATLGKFHLITPATWSLLSIAFSSPTIWQIRWLRRPCRICRWYGSIILRHRFYTTARWEMSLQVIEGLLTELAGTGRVPLEDEFITGALLDDYWSFDRRSHHAGTVATSLAHQSKYFVFDSSRYEKNRPFQKGDKLQDPFTNIFTARYFRPYQNLNDNCNYHPHLSCR